MLHQSVDLSADILSKADEAWPLIRDVVPEFIGILQSIRDANLSLLTVDWYEGKLRITPVVFHTPFGSESGLDAARVADYVVWSHAVDSDSKCTAVTLSSSVSLASKRYKYLKPSDWFRYLEDFWKWQADHMFEHLMFTFPLCIPEEKMSYGVLLQAEYELNVAITRYCSNANLMLNAFDPSMAMIILQESYPDVYDGMLPRLSPASEPVPMSVVSDIDKGGEPSALKKPRKPRSPRKQGVSSPE